MAQLVKSLAEVPGLEPLYDVCREHKVEITGFGSTIRRLCQKQFESPPTRPNIFELTPLLSDIDLMHSGPIEQTEAISNSILASVQSAECFRWNIFSEDQLRPFKEAEVYAPIIPAIKVTLGTVSCEGITNPMDAWSDLQRSSFRLIRNYFYERSALRRANRDCELVHALFFLQLVLESGGAGSPDKQPGWKECQRIIREHDLELVKALQESSYLRGRIRYRLKALRCLCGHPDLWKAITEESGLKELHSHPTGLVKKVLA